MKKAPPDKDPNSIPTPRTDAEVFDAARSTPAPKKVCLRPCNGPGSGRVDAECDYPKCLIDTPTPPSSTEQSGELSLSQANHIFAHLKRANFSPQIFSDADIEAFGRAVFRGLAAPSATASQSRVETLACYRECKGPPSEGCEFPLCMSRTAPSKGGQK